MIKKAVSIIFVGGIVVFLAFVIASFVGSLTPLPDWKIFWDAGSLFNPYDRQGFLNVWWAKLFLMPVHILTSDKLIGYGLWTVFTLFVTVYVFQNKKFYLLLSVASPYFMHQIINGQIDAIVILGYYLLQTRHKQWIAPALMTVKPQAMAGSLVVWATGSVYHRRLYQSALLIGSLAVVGFILYGNWIGQMIDNINTGLYQGVNASFVFYYPIVGAVLLALATWRNNVFLGGLATLFLTPYIAMHSLWVYWTAWLMGRPNKFIAILFAIVNWHVALRFTV